MRRYLPAMILTISLAITDSLTALGQDGSDIRPISIHDLNETHLNKPVHLDFYRQTFAGKPLDTVMVPMKGKLIQFIEHRQDNGYDNWFSEQYLTANHLIGEYQLRLFKSEIWQITGEEISVRNYFNYFNDSGLRWFDSPIVDTCIFKRAMIAGILLHSKESK